MGNNQSASSSPRRKASQVSRSSTLSSSPYMPGAETPRVVSQCEELSPGKDRTVGYELTVDVLGSQAPDKVKSVPTTPRPLSIVEGIKTPEAQVMASPTETHRDSFNLEHADAALSTSLVNQEELHTERTSDERTHGWLPGTYVLLNSRSGTALDLSGADQKTIIGFPAHMGQNQQWEFIPSGQGYAIRSARPSLCGSYLTVENLCDNAPVIANPFPTSWDVKVDREGSLQISWPGTDFTLDLADWGSATPGTKVQLMRAKPGEPCQLWKSVRCASMEDQQEKVTRSVMPPMITETIVVSEGKDDVVTTRTTTTTTITAVTTVTRAARRGVTS